MAVKVVRVDVVLFNPVAKRMIQVMLVGYRWLDDRIAIRDVFDDVGSKYVPPHVNIFYCFGCQGCLSVMQVPTLWT